MKRPNGSTAATIRDAGDDKGFTVASVTAIENSEREILGPGSFLPLDLVGGGVVGWGGGVRGLVGLELAKNT
jgi:hypothetical protein